MPNRRPQRLHRRRQIAQVASSDSPDCDVGVGAIELNAWPARYSLTASSSAPLNCVLAKSPASATSRVAAAKRTDRMRIFELAADHRFARADSATSTAATTRTAARAHQRTRSDSASRRSRSLSASGTAAAVRSPWPGRCPGSSLRSSTCSSSSAPAGVAPLRRSERRRVVRIVGPLGAVPLHDRVGRPLGVFVRLRVAAIARVRRAERHRQIGPRHAEAVVAPLVDPMYVVVGMWQVTHCVSRRPGAALAMMMVPARRTCPAGGTGCRAGCLRTSA